MRPIIDIQDYTERMGKSIQDKLYFVWHLEDIDREDLGYIVDFGCADGLMLRELHNMGFKNLIGYDNNWEMLSIARENCPSDIDFFGDFALMKAFMRENRTKKNILILSSVIHEVLHYCTNKEIQEFWNFSLDNIAFDYIFIRDMMPSVSINGKTSQSDLDKVHEHIKPHLIQDFEKEYGTLRSRKNFVHFLLKYRYEENWSRECAENYFPIYFEEFIALIPKWRDWKVIEHQTLHYIRERTREELGINLNEGVHLKMMIKTGGENR